MLTIRQEQMQAFEEPLLEIYIEKSTAYALKSWPIRAAEYPNREALRAFVAKCIRRGRALKFRDRGHLRKLLDWECEFGEDFVEKPEWGWLKRILETDIDHASRIFRVENRLEMLREDGELPA
jgi:hypothetical protein